MGEKLLHVWPVFILTDESFEKIIKNVIPTRSCQSRAGGNP